MLDIAQFLAIILPMLFIILNSADVITFKRNENMWLDKLLYPDDYSSLWRSISLSVFFLLMVSLYLFLF